MDDKESCPLAFFPLSLPYLQSLCSIASSSITRSHLTAVFEGTHFCKSHIGVSNETAMSKLYVSKKWRGSRRQWGKRKGLSSCRVTSSSRKEIALRHADASVISWARLADAVL